MQGASSNRFVAGGLLWIVFENRFAYTLLESTRSITARHLALFIRIIFSRKGDTSKLWMVRNKRIIFMFLLKCFETRGFVLRCLLGEEKTRFSRELITDNPVRVVFAYEIVRPVIGLRCQELNDCRFMQRLEAGCSENRGG